ncbi:hypothetical protein ACN4DW_04930 [Corynebacterium macclintockiae]|uniref:hypothetical protein n=1 Tax=Corynebacterium macclintockiae TaxID=2913501 RepID=UPI003EBB30CB
MKNFRKAALAIATASSVALAGTSVASAADDYGRVYGSDSTATQNVGKVLQADKTIKNGEQGNGPFQQFDQPSWWILTKTLTFTAFVSAIASVGIAIGNYLKNQGIII